MKRRTGNKKAARAIALALASMVAITSMPATALAEGETQEQPATGESGQEAPAAQESSTQEPAGPPTVDAVIGDIVNNDQENKDPGVSQAIDNAQAAVAAAVADVPELNNKDGDGITVQDYLQSAENSVDDKTDETGTPAQPGADFDKETIDYLNDLKNDIDTNNAAQEQAKADAEAINNAVNNIVVAELEPVTDESGNPVYEVELDQNGNPVFVIENYNEDGTPVYKQQMRVVYKNAFGEAVNKIEENLNNTSANVKTANESSSETVAKAAAENAGKALKNISDGLNEADKAIDAAEKGVQKAWEDLNEKQTAFNNATVELAKLEESLDGAKDESKNAHDDVVEAQKKVYALQKEMEEAYNQADEAELTLIVALYNKFNEAADNNKNTYKAYATEYNKLDSETKDLYGKWKSNPNDEAVKGLSKEILDSFGIMKAYSDANTAYWVEAGNLTKALIKYYISREDGYAGDFRISGGIDGEGYEDIAKDLLGYSKTVGDKYTDSEKTYDENGNPYKEYTRKDTTYNFPDVNHFDENGNPVYNWVEPGELNKGYVFRTDTGWVVNYSVGNGSQPNNVVVVRYKSKVAELDENGNPKTDEKGNPVYKVELNEDRSPRTDEKGNPIYVTRDVERYYNCKLSGGFCFFERTIEVVDGEVIDAVEGQKIDGYYVLGEDGKPVNTNKDVVSYESDLLKQYAKNINKDVNDVKDQGRYKTIDVDGNTKVLCESAKPKDDTSKTFYEEYKKNKSKYTTTGQSKWVYEVKKDGDKIVGIIEKKIQSYKEKATGTVIKDHVDQICEYEPRVFTKYHQDEVVGNNGLTLQTLEFSSDNRDEIDDVKDASVVEKFIKYQNAVGELNTAKDAVDKAEKKTKKLMDDIAKLKVTAPESKELEKLSARLEEAQTLLEAAKEHKEELQKLYDEAKAAVDKIDLSRFAIPVQTDDSIAEDDGTDTGLYYDLSDFSYASGDDGSSSLSSSLPAAGFSVTSGAGTGLALLPGITEPSGVAGARTSGTSGRGSGRAGQGVAGVRTGDAGSTIPAKKNVIAKNEPGETETIVKAKENDVDKKLVKLDDNKVPLDAAPNNGDNLYMLFLLLAAGIIAFFTVYTYNRHKKKAALAEEMKKYKN